MERYSMFPGRKNQYCKNDYTTKWIYRFNEIPIKLPYTKINSTKETKDLYTENYKTLMKEIKDDINRWRDIPCSWIGRINIVEMTTTKCNLQIQCDPYQITNGIFHRTRTKNFTIHKETQRSKQLQSQERRMELK